MTPVGLVSDDFVIINHAKWYKMIQSKEANKHDRYKMIQAKETYMHDRHERTGFKRSSVMPNANSFCDGRDEYDWLHRYICCSLWTKITSKCRREVHSWCAAVWFLCEAAISHLFAMYTSNFVCSTPPPPPPPFPPPSSSACACSRHWKPNSRL